MAWDKHKNQPGEYQRHWNNRPSHNNRQNSKQPNTYHSGNYSNQNSYHVDNFGSPWRNSRNQGSSMSHSSSMPRYQPYMPTYTQSRNSRYNNEESSYHEHSQFTPHSSSSYNHSHNDYRYRQRQSHFNSSRDQKKSFRERKSPQKGSFPVNANSNVKEIQLIQGNTASSPNTTLSSSEQNDRDISLQNECDKKLNNSNETEKASDSSLFQESVTKTNPQDVSSENMQLPEVSNSASVVPDLKHDRKGSFKEKDCEEDMDTFELVLADLDTGGIERQTLVSVETGSDSHATVDEDVRPHPGHVDSVGSTDEMNPLDDSGEKDIQDDELSENNSSKLSRDSDEASVDSKKTKSSRKKSLKFLRQRLNIPDEEEDKTELPNTRARRFNSDVKNLRRKPVSTTLQPSKTAEPISNPPVTKNRLIKDSCSKSSNSSSTTQRKSTTNQEVQHKGKSHQGAKPKDKKVVVKLPIAKQRLQNKSGIKSPANILKQKLLKKKVKKLLTNSKNLSKRPSKKKTTDIKVKSVSREKSASKTSNVQNKEPPNETSKLTKTSAPETEVSQPKKKQTAVKSCKSRTVFKGSTDKNEPKVTSKVENVKSKTEEKSVKKNDKVIPSVQKVAEVKRKNTAKKSSQSALNCTQPQKAPLTVKIVKPASHLAGSSKTVSKSKKTVNSPKPKNQQNSLKLTQTAKKTMPVLMRENQLQNQQATYMEMIKKKKRKHFRGGRYSLLPSRKRRKVGDKNSEDESVSSSSSINAFERPINHQSLFSASGVKEFAVKSGASSSSKCSLIKQLAKKSQCRPDVSSKNRAANENKCLNFDEILDQPFDDILNIMREGLVNSSDAKSDVIEISQLNNTNGANLHMSFMHPVTVKVSNTVKKNCNSRITNYLFLQLLRTGNCENVQSALSQGANPNCRFRNDAGNFPLHVASSYGHLDIAKILVQLCPNINCINGDLKTPLTLAMEKQNIEMVELLLRSGADSFHRDQTGMLPLHIAATAGNLPIAKLIHFHAAASINCQDDGGWTPLVWACEYGNHEIVSWLIDKGADPNITDKAINTAIHWAAFSGCELSLQAILTKGTNVSKLNKVKDTPLHIASRQNHFECVKLLVSHGANLHIKNDADETPILCCGPTNSPTAMFLRHKSAVLCKASKKKGQLLSDVSFGQETIPIEVVNEIDKEPFDYDFGYVMELCESNSIAINRLVMSMNFCKCQGMCMSGSCSCTLLNFRLSYAKNCCLRPDFNMTHPPVIFECSDLCNCSQNCLNRVVQRGIRCPMQVFRTYGKGWGVRVLHDVPRGSFICEYLGELITDEEAEKRSDDSYLMDLDNESETSHCIDARSYGNVARFINHSCAPNLTPIKVFIDHQDLSFPHIALFTNRNIKANEELSFDYGDTFWVVKSRYFLCRCEQPQCKYSVRAIDKKMK